MTTTRVAAIDCGTNSIRLLVADVTSDGLTKSDLVREMRIVRLGEGVDQSGRLAPAAIERTVEATRQYAEIIGALDAEVIRFCATSAARDAENGADFSAAIESVLGVRPEIITGDVEARASFDGATREVGAGRSAVIDLGGGSTEVVVGTSAEGTSEVEWARSFDVGSVRLTERFLHTDPPSIAELSDCERHLDGVLAATLAGLQPVETIVGVAGTITTLAAFTLDLDSYDSERIHRAELAVDDLRNACMTMAAMPVADRRLLPFMHPGRADVIAAGALILDRVLEHLPTTSDHVTISENDILDGIAFGAV